MSSHNIGFCGEIRKKSVLLLFKKMSTLSRNLFTFEIISSFVFYENYRTERNKKMNIMRFAGPRVIKLFFVLILSELELPTIANSFLLSMKISLLKN